MAALASTAFLLIYWLPTDLESIRDGLASEPRLALGISLKILMHLLAVLGLYLDKTFGYAFLLGASLQGLLVASGAFRALPTETWWLYRSQLIAPTFDIYLRIFCLVFLATRPGRLIGKEAPQ